MDKEITPREYANKIVEVAYYEIMPNKETITNILEALIKGYADQQNKHLTEQLTKLQGKTNFDEVEVLKELLALNKTAYSDLVNRYSNLFKQLAEKENELSDVRDILLNCRIVIDRNQFPKTYDKVTDKLMKLNP
jgi:hypothetical protein